MGLEYFTFRSKKKLYPSLSSTCGSVTVKHAFDCFSTPSGLVISLYLSILLSLLKNYNKNKQLKAKIIRCLCPHAGRRIFGFYVHVNVQIPELWFSPIARED